MATCKVAICGCGTVGMGVANILLGRRGALGKHIDVPVELSCVVDLRKDEVLQELSPPSSVKVTDDFSAAVEDPGIDVVVELIGGTDVARTVISSALEAGKDVVTANKALLAESGRELFEIASRNNASLAFEASVAGGIPIISAIRDGLVAEDIGSFYGIVNGTCNYVLTKMTRENVSYEKALKEAQQRGYAEADPTLDVEGYDSAHKLAVLARLAFGVDVNLEDIYCEGVDNIEPEDLQYAGSLGYTLKLLAIGIKHDRMVELRVQPALLDHDHPLAAISGANNAVCLHGDSVGEVMLTGPGAGRWPTASAVIADISRLALGTYQLEFGNMAQFGGVEDAELVPQDQVRMRYYFRLSCLDRPGVLARVAGILGEYNISIDSCIQKGKSSEGKAHVPVVFMTHMAREGDLTQALKSINELQCIAGSKTRMLRVQDI